MNDMEGPMVPTVPVGRDRSVCVKLPHLAFLVPAGKA